MAPGVPGNLPSELYVGAVTSSKSSHGVVVVGGGHNGLVAAAHLARTGLSVLALERLDHTGGAAVSAQAFSGRPALAPLLPRLADAEQLIAR